MQPHSGPDRGQFDSSCSVRASRSRPLQSRRLAQRSTRTSSAPAILRRHPVRPAGLSFVSDVSVARASRAITITNRVSAADGRLLTGIDFHEINLAVRNLDLDKVFYG